MYISSSISNVNLVFPSLKFSMCPSGTLLKTVPSTSFQVSMQKDHVSCGLSLLPLI